MGKKKKKNHRGLLAFFIILIVLAGIVCFIIYVPIIKHDAATEDITMDYSMDLTSMGIKCKVLPQRNIQDLKITLGFTDLNYETATSVNKFVGNVKKGVQIELTYSLTEFGFTGEDGYVLFEQCEHAQIKVEGTVKITVWELIVEKIMSA